MFIETLEFTIPVDLCDLFSSMKRGPQSNLEFPASVNSYGTTQDANIQVVLRSNKLTFKVDGVSSNSSMISKSECKTLKLSVFDVDCSLPEAETFVEQPVHQSTPYVNPAKRPNDRPSRPPPAKASRTSYSNSSPKPQDIPSTSNVKVETEQVNIKQEPDLIEIEPDPDPYEDSSDMQTSQAALDRLSHPRSNSSSSSFHQNVPHVQDYSEPGPSHHSAEDYIVYQDTGDNDFDDDNDNSADFGNDGGLLRQHSRERHIANLKVLCRICGKDAHIMGSPKEGVFNELYGLFNIDIRNDRIGVHPHRICKPHRTTLYRYKIAMEKGKNYKTIANPLNFKPFDPKDTNCFVCFGNHKRLVRI